MGLYWLYMGCACCNSINLLGGISGQNHVWILEKMDAKCDMCKESAGFSKESGKKRANFHPGLRKPGSLIGQVLPQIRTKGLQKSQPHHNQTSSPGILYNLGLTLPEFRRGHDMPWDFFTAKLWGKTCTLYTAIVQSRDCVRSRSFPLPQKGYPPEPLLHLLMSIMNDGVLSDCFLNHVNPCDFFLSSSGPLVL